MTIYEEWLEIIFLSVPSITEVTSAQEGENTESSSVEPPTDLDLSVKNVGQDVEFQLSTSFDETIRVASQILRMFFTRCVSWYVVYLLLLSGDHNNNWKLNVHFNVLGCTYSTYNILKVLEFYIIVTILVALW